MSRSTLVNNHVIGTVSRRGKQKSGQVIYEVAWNNSQYGVTQISHSNVYTGIENHTRLQSQLPRGNSRRPTSGIALPKPTDPFDVPGMDALLSKSRRGEPELAPCSSGSDSDNDDNAGDEDMIEEAIDKLFSQVTHMDRASASNWDFDDNDHLFASDNEEELSLNVDDIQGLDWNPRGTVGPKDFKSLPRPSTIVPQFRSCFDNPTRSFFSFLPIAMWEKIVYESNTYAHEKMRITKKHNIAGYYWRQDISLQEMMQFFGLLIQMALLPIPGRDYRFYWTEQQLYPWVACMTLRRFKQIRSTLHFNVSDCEDSLDPLHKVRPIYATIQEMMGRYVDLGSEFSLDEASAACRSSFGRHLIVFNPMKNCGKFHFRFYLLCCSVTYVCIKVRIHVRTDEMVEADKFVCESFENEDGKEEQASSKVLNQLILDMARPIFNKGITLNFNNYYASPGIAVALLRHKVLCRGTLRRNKKLIPPYILFTKAEGNKKENRGSVKMTVNERYGLIAAGWIDGNPVHIISSADTTDLTQVRRRVGGDRKLIQAPEAVANYNKGMDGVDRHDQYRSLISLCSRHGFKKYYVKLMLALADIAITNANLHFKLRWKGVQGSPMSSMSRVDFFMDIADKLMSADRKWAVDAGVVGLEAISGGESTLPDEAMAKLFHRERTDTMGIAITQEP